MAELREHPVLEKNHKAAQMWNSGGADYDLISQSISAALDHAVTRLAPEPGARVLDIATGTGFTARLLARRGASVTGVDMAEDLLAAAGTLAEREGLAIQWRLGDAERLPFPDASFDAAISTFGVMFAADQEAAISELARVVRSGGRIAYAAWTPDSQAVDMRKVVAPYMPPPPADAPTPPSPFNWGDPTWVRTSLGTGFSLGFETAEVIQRFPDVETAWTVYEQGFGPVRAVATALTEDDRAKLRRDFIAWLDQFRTELGMAIPIRYLVAAGRRDAGG